MCLRVVEQYAVCRCVYYVHGVDQCNSYGMRGHDIQDRVVLVGHTCADHSYSMNSSQSSSTQSSPSGHGGAPCPQFIGQRASGIGAQLRQQQQYHEQQQRATGAYVQGQQQQQHQQPQQQQQQYYAQYYNGYSR